MKHQLKQLFSVLLVASLTLTAATGCKKNNSELVKYGNTPRTNPLPEEVSSEWQMTTSGGGYVYDGVHYGNSSHGIEIMMKENGTGWWNEIQQQATPTCVLIMNLSLDCTFEMHNENGRNRIFVYGVSGRYHSEDCSTTKDYALSADKLYPKYPPFKYDYKIVTADDNDSQKLLVLSQEEDESKRFKAGLDKTMSVLKLI